MSILYMPFLYFPTDKSEYIPAVISLVFFMALACFALYFVYKKSKKDEQKFNEEYKNRIDKVSNSSEDH